MKISAVFLAYPHILLHVLAAFLIWSQNSQGYPHSGTSSSYTTAMGCKPSQHALSHLTLSVTRAETWFTLGHACASYFAEDKRTVSRLMTTALRLSSKEDSMPIMAELAAFQSMAGFHDKAINHFLLYAYRNSTLQSVGNLALSFRHAFKSNAEVDVLFPALMKEHPDRVYSDKHRALLPRMLETMMDACYKWDNASAVFELVKTYVMFEISNELPSNIFTFTSVTLPFSGDEIRNITEYHYSYLKAGLVGSIQSMPKMQLKTYTLKKNERLRVGFVAAHFDQRKLMNGFFQCFWKFVDRSKFEYFAFAWNPSADRNTSWIESMVEHYVGFANEPDLTIAMAIQERKPHVVIDMTGWYPERNNVLVALGLAPVQLFYRYPSTFGEQQGMSIVDKIVVPPDYSRYFSEKLIYLPNSYLISSHEHAFETQIEDRNQTVARMRLNLPLNVMIIAAANRYYKINHELALIWADYLKKNPSSYILFIRYRFFLDAERNLRSFFSRHDIDNDRIIFLDEGGPAFFLQVAIAVDLFLDSIPPLVNGHTTTVDVIWANTPVITAPGTRMVERVAAALLIWSKHNRDLLVARNAADYSLLLGKTGKKNIVDSNYNKDPLRIDLFDTRQWVNNFERSVKYAFELYVNGKKSNLVMN